ncbi:MAG: DNA replication/repair protein RecF [Actinomycetia bacterium]|nr:DNA replication/repair protein RecF [Actinomycetes bacterium]
MLVRELWLTDFRSYATAHLLAAEGTCVIRGRNGVGKTNLLEAIGYLATLSSFRGAPNEALIRAGADSAVVRAEVEVEGRVQLLEAEISRNGRNRVQVNRQRLRRASDLLGTLRVSVFSPDDLELVKGGPSGRRNLLDDLLVALHPRNQSVRSDWEKALRQRNALLKQVGGRLDESAELTLEVWDDKAAAAGEELASLRSALVERLAPAVTSAYRDIAGEEVPVELVRVAGWSGSLADALRAARKDDLRRGVTTVGPHRDELSVLLEAMPARTHASQGEQRCLALALRLASHREVAEETGTPPVLLLDDVFSELDPKRCEALVGSLPAGQAFLSTAAVLPEAVKADQEVEVTPGELSRVSD